MKLLSASGKASSRVATTDLVVEMGLSTVRTFCAFEQHKSSFVVFVWDISVTLLILVLLNKSCVSGSMLLPGTTQGSYVRPSPGDTGRRVPELHSCSFDIY